MRACGRSVRTSGRCGAHPPGPLMLAGNPRGQHLTAPGLEHPPRKITRLHQQMHPNNPAGTAPTAPRGSPGLTTAARVRHVTSPWLVVPEAAGKVVLPRARGPELNHSGIRVVSPIPAASTAPRPGAAWPNCGRGTRYGDQMTLGERPRCQPAVRDVDASDAFGHGGDLRIEELNVGAERWVQVR